MIGFRRGQDKVPLSGWLLSYADMATILLALFIVVSVLSRDQTGSSLYRSSGSYLQAVKQLGAWEEPSCAAQQQSSLSSYLGSPEERQAGSSAGAVAEQSWWQKQQEEDRLEQLLFELGRQHMVLRLPRQASQLVIDLYAPLSRKAPRLQALHQQALERLLPLLQRSDYRLQVVVWATTPAPSAWARAAEQAQEAYAEVISSHQLDADVAGRLTWIGQPWPYRDVRRPVLSLVLLRSE